MILEVPSTQTDDLERFYGHLENSKKNRFLGSYVGKDGREKVQNTQHLELKIRWEVARV